MRISRLNKDTHDRNKFDCGEEALNNFLKLQSGQNDKKDLSRTFVLTSSQNPSQIKGFYSLASCTIKIEQLPHDVAKKYSGKDLCCALIGRLAVNEKHQGQRFGDNLLMGAIRAAVQSSELVPTPMIIIDAKTPRVREWYEKFGFIAFPQTPDRLYMSQPEARRLIKEASSG